MRDNPTLQQERGVRGIVRRARVGHCGLIPSLREVCRRQARDRPDRSEEVVEHVPPVTEHIHGDTAALLLAVVPGGTLRGDQVTLENPVTELAPHREDPTEEPPIPEAGELEEPRQPELVQHDAVLHPSRARRAPERESVGDA